MTSPSPNASALGFPADFLWGASTSAFQVEGAAAEDGRGPSIWDTFCRLKGRVDNGDTGDVACDHYHRYAEDVALMRRIGLGAYRFSIAWPRVLPRGRGAVNPLGLDFYDRLIDRLLEAGIEPWACLYHWDLPQALQDHGGWANRDSAGWFADYAVLCAKRYGDRVKRWATFNEFSVFTLFGYALGWGAPSVADRGEHLKVIHHVNLAHGAGVDVLRDLVPGASIGAVHSVQPCRPEDDSPDNVEGAALFNELWNLAFPDAQILGHYPPRIARAVEPYVQAGDMARIARPVDWFGLNHYAPLFAKADPSMVWGCGFGSPPADMPRTDIGWPLQPEAFREALLDLTARYRLPIYVTENGYGTKTPEAPDDNGVVMDTARIDYLRACIAQMAGARRDGADVRGYFVWSLLDNFEWGGGYGTRFGIVHVDFATQTRTPKESAHWYAALIGSALAESGAESGE
ncbi:GH1 family beta-glucosidase [Azospirillum rugosum]|uniref:Beta-glucosidase n=1 Tax=Azospirillum rugosum TaxID=416170 RepID=A0ABS4SFK2_9PROT|nr:GH1 family beta-glucosidase [Azospirillum rugosum]MBP2291354.1 beta-glucosidase [Azospirillum rugosum]MDQ0525142.1 beta-glucosidase [Azospirillum rugosum]